MWLNFITEVEAFSATCFLKSGKYGSLEGVYFMKARFVSLGSSGLIELLSDLFLLVQMRLSYWLSSHFIPSSIRAKLLETIQ